MDQSAAGTGLALLQLRAEPDWMHRRVMQVEFVDTRVVSWRVNLEFFVPGTAPAVKVGDELIRLIPIADLPGAQFPVVSQGNGHASPVWQPTPQETGQHLASALAFRASEILEVEPEQLPELLAAELARIVSADADDLRLNPSALLAAGALIDAERRYYPALRERLRVEEELHQVAFRAFGRRRELQRQWADLFDKTNCAWECLRRARADWDAIEAAVRRPARRLMENPWFRSQVEELARNLVLVVGVAGLPGDRWILETTYEAPLTFRHSVGRLARLLQSLGWRFWPLVVRVCERGGSQQLQVTAPAGAEIAGIAAEPAAAGTAPEPVPASGGTSHAHIQLPADGQVRYGATVFARLARPGWLTCSWLVAVAIGYAMVLSRLEMSVLFSASPGLAGTAAALLPVLLGVFTTLLIGGRQHPLVSRLLLPLRLLILLDFAVVLIAFGSLVLHRSDTPLPVLLWTVLAGAALAVALLVSICWLLPARRSPTRNR